MIRWFKKKNKETISANLDHTDIISLGQKADDALKNFALIAAFDSIERNLCDAWRRSPPAQEKEREHLYYRLEGLASVKAKLTGMLNNMIIESKKREKEKVFK